LLTSFSSGGKVGCPIFLLDTEGHGNRFPLVYLRYPATPQKLLTGFSSGGKVGMRFSFLTQKGMAIAFWHWQESAIASRWSISDILQLLKSC
jgi:hypothetical protein